MSLAIISLTACVSKDATYYRSNPQELQKALKLCPAQPSPLITCDQLKNIAVDVNELAYSLQMNPQEFGNKIINLQNQLALLQAEFKKNPNQLSLNQQIQAVKGELSNRLAIVKWLESPES